jgi:hypothetical protein
MIGMTPAWLTLSGMYVLPPEVIRRPTTRLAYWTGILRWPCSMNTTATTSASPIISTVTNLAVPPWSRMARPSCGNREITLVKISTDMPLPIPRWVISSPIHMIIAVPAVMIMTISAMLRPVKVPGGKMSTPPSWSDPEWNRKTRPVDCSSARTTVT